MIFRNNKFIIPKTIGPNVNVDGLVEEINRGQTRIKVNPELIDAAVMETAIMKLQQMDTLNALNTLKPNDTEDGIEDGTREETKVQA